MKFLIPPTSSFLAPLSAALLSATIVSCSGSESASRAQAATAATSATQSAIRTQPVDADPCGWLPRVEVERLLGPLSEEPTRVSDAEQFEQPDPQGTACLYRLARSAGGLPALIAIGIVLDGATTLETGLGATITAVGLAGFGASDDRNTSTGRWDWTHELPGGVLSAARQGHIAVMTSVRAPGLPRERVDSLTAAIVDRIPDLPFSEGNSTSRNSGADPCALVTRAEAEAVLGTLVVPPYRSRESTPFANVAGASCAYYTAGHHVLVLTPTRDGGKTIFKMVGGLTQNVSSRLGVNAVDDTLDGPWDQTARSLDGTLYFLKGDRLLEVQYRTSSTNLSGAVRLASAALGRL